MSLSAKAPLVSVADSSNKNHKKKGIQLVGRDSPWDEGCSKHNKTALLWSSSCYRGARVPMAKGWSAFTKP